MRRMIITFVMLLLSLVSIAPQISDDIIKDEITKAKWILKEMTFRSSNFTQQLLYEALLFNGIQNPEIVVKQSVVETGNFKSKLFIATNNPFGMHLAARRKSTTSEFVYGDFYDGEFHKVAKFNCWYDAVLDFKYWQTFWLNDILTEREYYKFLYTLPYAVNPNYINMVKSVKLDITAS